MSKQCVAERQVLTVAEYTPGLPYGAQPQDFEPYDAEERRGWICRQLEHILQTSPSERNRTRAAVALGALGRLTADTGRGPTAVANVQVVLSAGADAAPRVLPGGVEVHLAGGNGHGA